MVLDYEILTMDTTVVAEPVVVVPARKPPEVLPFTFQIDAPPPMPPPLPPPYTPHVPPQLPQPPPP